MHFEDKDAICFKLRTYIFTRMRHMHNYLREVMAKVSIAWVWNELRSNIYLGASQVAFMVKNTPASAKDIRDVIDAGSIPGSGQSPGEGHGNPLQ